MKYQAILSHGEQGYGKHLTPHYDLGLFELQDFVDFAAFLCAATQQKGLDLNELPVTNILEAWGSLDYHCWLLPQDPALPCYDYTDDIHLVPPDKDPR